MTADSDAGPIEDIDHPIPRLDTLDVLRFTDRGAYVGIVIASPLKDDAISRARLLRKIEVSLGYFRSAEYRERYGAPDPKRSRLWVHVHADSDARMLALLEHYCSQFVANGVTARLELIGTN